MPLFVKILRIRSGVGAVICRQRQHGFQQAVYTGVHRFLRELPFPDRFDHLAGRVHARRGHLQIGSCLHAPDMVVGAAPVRDHDPFISPFIPQDIF